MSLSRVKSKKRKIKNVKARRDIKRKRAKKMLSSHQKKQWEEHKQFIDSRKDEEYIVSAKKALDWFLEILGDDEWSKRKRKVVDYFKQQQMSLIPGQKRQSKFLSKENSRIAYYKDWTAWYLYLVESLYYRPYVSQPSQSCRVYPFFSNIGRNIDLAQKIGGIEKKLNEWLKGKDNQPDSTLFEISVALMYAKNGWNVEFIQERADKKTPDLYVTKHEDAFFVECKRQAKVSEYSENERVEWNKRWDKLVPFMNSFKESLFIDVTFKKEVKDT